MVKGLKVANLEDTEKSEVYFGMVTCPHCKKRHGVSLELPSKKEKKE